MKLSGLAVLLSILVVTSSGNAQVVNEEVIDLECSGDYSTRFLFGEIRNWQAYTIFRIDGESYQSDAAGAEFVLISDGRVFVENRNFLLVENDSGTTSRINRDSGMFSFPNDFGLDLVSSNIRCRVFSGGF